MNIPSSAELRQMMEQEQQNPKQVYKVKNTINNALLQASTEASTMPLNTINDVDVPIDNSAPLEALMDADKQLASLQPHSPFLEDDEPSLKI